MSEMMRAARIHEIGKPLVVEEVPIPELGDDDVLIEVKAVHIAQYHTSALLRVEHSYPIYPPKFPAILGMGAAGFIAKVGSNVPRFRKGERVVVNPILTCGNCEYCLDGRPGLCDMWVLHGYYALFTPNGLPLIEKYPGGFAQYTKVPARNVIRLPANVPFEHACRFNYTGVSYEGLKNGGFRPGMTVLINGATGTLGTDAVLLSLAMGAARVIAIGRNRDRLGELKAKDPERVFTINSAEESIVSRIHELTDGKGVHVYLDTLGYGAGGQTPPIDIVHECLRGLRKGGSAVFIGALQGQKVEYDYGEFVGNEVRLTGSVWYNNKSLSELVDMAAGGTLKLDSYDTKIFSLEEINEALEYADQRLGGLKHIVVKP